MALNDVLCSGTASGTYSSIANPMVGLRSGGLEASS